MDLPSERQLRWILRRSALLHELGAEPVSGLVTPTAEHFPDTFDGSPNSVAALMRRIQMHAGLDDVKVALSIVTPDGQQQSVSCSSGGCGGGGKIEVKLDRVARLEDGSYQVALGAGELGNPAVLTTALVRSVAFIFLDAVDGYDGLRPAEREPFTDLAAIHLGFGVLIANGSYVFMKGCSGAQVHSATQMPVDETTLALAIYARLHDVSERAASKHLTTTPAAHFEESYAWASSNDKVVRLITSDRTTLEEDRFSLLPSRSWLARTLGIGKKKAVTPDEEVAELERALAAQPVKRAAMDPAKKRNLEELKALVDESFE
jgi:hypothetical protein